MDELNAKTDMPYLLESLASTQHEIWAHWMTYLFNCCHQNNDGTYTIPIELVQRWTNQIHTVYENLSEKEKDSDREIALKIISVINRRC